LTQRRPSMSTRSFALWLALIVPALLLAGCALDPIEEQEEKLESMEVVERRQAVTSLKALDDERTVELLVETLEGDPELMEEAGNALVLKGREWEQEHPRAKKSEQNPVIEQLSNTISDMHLESAVRTKACWILGEIGSRRAIAALKGRLSDPSSMDVRAESTTSLQKLGYYADAAQREMLGDGEFVESYVPEERGMVIEEAEETEETEAEEEEPSGEAA
jgi:HEAT repeat protein